MGAGGGDRYLFTRRCHGNISLEYQVPSSQEGGGWPGNLPCSGPGDQLIQGQESGHRYGDIQTADGVLLLVDNNISEYS